MERLKTQILDRIKDKVEILKKVMTKENVNEITYGDKLASLGGLNELVFVMKYIDPSYELDLEKYLTKEEVDDMNKKKTDDDIRRRFSIGNERFYQY